MLRFVLGDLAKRLGFAPRLDVLCGTSVGALNACWLAATADQDAQRAQRLESLWYGMRSDDLLRLGAGARGWSGLAFGALRAAALGRTPAPLAAGGGLLDRAPFEALVLRAIPWERIRANREAGLFHALSVTATEIASGCAVVFLESRDGPPRHFAADPTIVARSAEIAPAHALASAAIPVVFPTIAIGGRHYVDGALRLNTPLVPALRLGADRILVVALRAPPGGADAAPADEPAPDAFALLGKALSALLLDPVDADLARLRFVNDMLRRAERAFGADALERLNETGRAEGGPPLRLIEETVIRPSEDPRALATDAMARIRARGRLSPALRLFGRGLAGADGDLYSYILFDGEYTGALCALGAEDARRREEELARFFCD